MTKKKWLDIDGNEIIELPKNAFGFVYAITYESGKKYIGKKKVISVINKKAKLNGKKRKGHVRFFNRIVKRKRTKYEEVITESKWREYEGSSELINENDHVVRKVILMVLDNEAATTYYEAKMLFTCGAIESDKYYNESIFGRLYKKTTKGIIQWKNKHTTMV